MKIEGNLGISGQGYVLSGYYTWRATGSPKPKLFELSSPSYLINNFSPPYDAYLPSPNLTGSSKYIAVGRKLKSSLIPIASNLSGALYYFDSADLIGTCHGWGRPSGTFYSGYNFYNAFYAGGYFMPPFGEIPAVMKLKLSENESEAYSHLNYGQCGSMSVTEYNERFGIISKYAADAGATSDTIVPSTFHQIMSLKQTCPEGSIAVDAYYDEWQAKQVPGTASSLAATPAQYNENPIPSSLDNYENWTDGRYQYITDSTDVKHKINKIQFGPDHRPVPSYSTSDTNHSKLNNALCYAQLFETDTSIGRLTNGIQRIETPDVTSSASNSQVSAAGQEPWHYWHFLFRENADTIPFASDMKHIKPGVTWRGMLEGTQMIDTTLSSEDSYWQNRQCPDTVDYLPWTFGGAIYACPSQHFDVPYYAARKRFGFYGTRFLNSCTRLNLSNTWSGVPNSLEIPSGTGMDINYPDTEPTNIDLAGNFTFSMYDSLLKLASAEERYSNMYALNKGFFIWANDDCIRTDSSWSGLTGTVTGFQNIYESLVEKFQRVYVSGLSTYMTSGEPVIIMTKGKLSTSYTLLDSGRSSDLLFTNSAYEYFLKQLGSLLSGSSMSLWKTLEGKYGYYVTDCSSGGLVSHLGTGINTGFYNQMVSGREKRMRTRYFENLFRGNPIDLFPLNHIYFSTDNAKGYYESSEWGRSPNSFGKASHLPSIQRRYFEGAYGQGGAIAQAENIINSISNIKDSAFYPGFWNTYDFGKDIPTPTYVPVLSGFARDTSGHRFSTSGWLAAGYREIGALDANFSCFTPIFVQQPLPKVYCKIGQPPTFRALAVDYHSIPEDKMSPRYPEITYWTHKLKITDSQMKNLYPLKYKWFRLKKNKYKNFVSIADLDSSEIEFSNPTGIWCALEGDNRTTCTVIHPLACQPQYGNHTADAYTYIDGAQYRQDDQYYYFCMALGRFGIRISEPSELVIENWLRFDVSVKNGANMGADIRIDFDINSIWGDDTTISFEAEKSLPYNGYQRDKYAIPETVVEQKMPPPNAGWGDVWATRFIGPWGYVGATRSYSPDTLKDTRGLREVWGRLLDYGTLVSFSKRLTQFEGALLYGHKHLPTCENYTMARGKKGIKTTAYVNDMKVRHWTLEQQAYAVTDNRFGMRWNKINGVGSLYPPTPTIYDIFHPNMGIGHWQWGNNLGSIKRFGAFSGPDDNDIVINRPGSIPDQSIVAQIKKKFILPTTLAGENCGYSPCGLGRNMLYYIEAYDRFYLHCDPLKKKNVTNLSFMCPGLRNTNSAIQYFWLGKPSNTYVERRAMYGPYAYQWRVRRHNRDRNGNGISEGFYSMNYETRYELMYDAPAIYGLYIKPPKYASPEFIDKVHRTKGLRRAAIGILNEVSLRSLWFGEGGSEGSFKRYGNYTFSCNPASWAYNSNMCEYVSTAQGLAGSPDFRAYSCPQDALQNGQCFDPCVSIRYGQGFFPGGKGQTMFGYQESTNANLPVPKNLRLVANATYTGSNVVRSDEKSVVDPNLYFRSPVNTPHARVWAGLTKIDGTILSQREMIAGISPCQDGGSDHCNYMTATLHLDTSSSLVGLTSAYISSVSSAANMYAEYNIRGGD